MALDNHRNRWMPDVSYARDGTIVLGNATDTVNGKSSNGVKKFSSLRHVPLHRQQSDAFPLASEGITVISPANTLDRRSVHSLPTYRDHDPRSKKPSGDKRRYRQKVDSKFALEKKGLSTGSWRTAPGGSVDKKAKRRKESFDSANSSQKKKVSEGPHGSINHSSTNGSRAIKKHKRKDAAIRRSKSLDGTYARKSMNGATSVKYSSERGTRHLEVSNGKHLSNGTIQRSGTTQPNGMSRTNSKTLRNDVTSVPTNVKKIHYDVMPWKIFIIVGPMLIMLGVLRLVIVTWHEYLNEIWSGILVSV